MIPAFNEEAYLPATLASVRAAMASVELPGEVIVVDNASTDRTAEVARAHGADRVVFEPVNQIARARNAGARAAAPESRFLVFLDADTHLSGPLLRQALDHLVAGDTCGGGAVTVADQPMPFYVERLLALWNWSARILGMAAGSYVWCLREGFEAAGGFDESVYAGEEVWFSKRLRRWGKRRKLKFRVLSHPPIVTSGRKSVWFSGWDFAKQVTILFLF
ncbi:MAG: glycosyltransferase, partial [Verrucomicrobiae bacterium]|nr:glycosyltransferase [Verrucomicrobiae bacterium]